MKSQQALKILLGIYIFIFFAYLFGPLVIMSITAFNSAEFPSVTPWECFSLRWFNEGKIAYDGQHLAGLATDWRLHEGLITSLKIGLGVVLLAVPIGLSAALVLTQVHSRLRTAFYSISIMPVLFPGVIIGISTVVLWDRIATMGGGGLATQLGRNGVFLTILAQTCFISTILFFNFCRQITTVRSNTRRGSFRSWSKPDPSFFQNINTLHDARHCFFLRDSIPSVL